MAESSAIPQLAGLEIEAVEWLPSGADSGLVRVRGRWRSLSAAQPGLPELLLRADGADHRFESLPDARFARDPASWRGSYLVPGALVERSPEALWVEWPGGVRCGLPALAHGLASPPPAAAVELAPEEPGGQVIDRAVLAERRARRAEAAEREQGRVAAEALKAVEALELQSAELERRLAEAMAERDALAEPAPGGAAGPEPAAGAAGPAPVPAGARAASARVAAMPSPEELARLAERRQAALASALDSLARLRAQSREWRLALRTGEVVRSSDAVRLAVLEAERSLGDADPRGALKARTRELSEERARAASLEEVRAELEAGLAEARGEAAEARAELERAREAADARLAAALAAADATREQLERRRRGEHAVHEEVRAELLGRLEATESRANALEAAQAELAADRASATARAESLGARIAELETALAVAETGLATAEASAANAEARLRVESVARAALETELDRAREGGDAAALAAELEAERAARAAERDARTVADDPSPLADELAAELEAERAARAAAETDLTAARDELAATRAAAETDLTAARDELAAARTDFEAALAAEREARAAAEAALAEAFEAAAQQGRTLQDRIAELERGAAGLADEVRLANAAREQAEAAASATAPPPEQSGRMLADLDAAAAALRSAAPPAEVEPPAEAGAPAGVEPPAEAGAPAGVEPPAEVELPAAPPERVRPKIVSASGPPPRVDAIGRSARDYPRLRGAIVKLAHDDPAAAAQLLAALLPAQTAALATPLDYDLTIAEAGTFSVKMGGSGRPARVHARPEPRGRPHAEFHLSADALTLAELLAGVEHRIGRWRGPARFTGSRRKLDVLRALPATSISLAEAARAGADLEPALVYRTLSYAVHPSWTKGERFTLAQEITGARPETWYLSARDGAGMTVSASPPDEGVEATVAMSRATFALMLRDEPVPSGERPVVRGDRRVVALVKTWMDRAQHGV
jgi:hypothetical protein